VEKYDSTGSFDSDDGEIAWARHGEGPPLLLINGYAATGADWDPMFLAALAARFSVICPDNRGTGGSDLGVGEMTVARLAADCIALLDALEVDRVTVVGWSMGGFVAQELVAAGPDRVGELVLLAQEEAMRRWHAEPAGLRLEAFRRRPWSWRTRKTSSSRPRMRRSSRGRSPAPGASCSPARATLSSPRTHGAWLG
jgi:pimeloyl-ACP methyl ester carboxylesterase